MTVAEDQIAAIATWLKSKERAWPERGVRDDRNTGTFATIVSASLSVAPTYSIPGDLIDGQPVGMDYLTQRRGNLFLFSPTTGAMSPAAPFPPHNWQSRFTNQKVVSRAKTILSAIRAGTLPGLMVVALSAPGTTINAALSAAGLTNPGNGRGLLAIPTWAMDRADAAEIEALLPVI